MYATAQDMRDRYGEAVLVQLTDTSTWGAATIAAIEVKLTDATFEADGYVSKYYKANSGTPVPPLLKMYVMRIAFADLAQNPTEEATKQRDRAIAALVKVSQGLIKLDQGDPAALESRDGQVIVPEAERTFSRNRLSDF